MSKVTIDAKVTGPFFQYGKTAVKDATSEWVTDMVREGEAKVEAELYAGHGVATGEYKRHVGGKILSSAHGVVHGATDKRNAIVGAWLEGSSSRNAKHRFKGWHLWRKARAHLNRLNKELGGKVFARVTKRLT